MIRDFVLVLFFVVCVLGSQIWRTHSFFIYFLFLDFECKDFISVCLVVIFMVLNARSDMQLFCL